MSHDTSVLLKKAASGDLTARDELFQKNIGLVYSIAKKFMNRGVEFDDLVQLGSIGLVNAIKKFDESYNVMFSTYAVPLIIGEIKRYLRDNGPIKVSRTYRTISLKAGFARESLMKEKGREPTIGEIADRLDIDKTELAAVLEATQMPESLFASTGESEKILLVDKISGGIDNEGSTIERLSLEEVISLLNERERKIIMMRYFGDKKQTEIAKAIGISQVQVSRLEKQILNKMREKIV